MSQVYQSSGCNHVVDKPVQSLPKDLTNPLSLLIIVLSLINRGEFMTTEPVNDFYTQVPADQLTATGNTQPEAARQYITDPNIAHDIALVQDQEGMAAAKLREDYLRKTHEEGGYTPDQVENIKLMDALQEKFPNSFDVITIQTGEKILLSRPVPEEVVQQLYYEKQHNIGTRQLLTPYGFMDISKQSPREMTMVRFNELLTKADYTDLVALLKSKGFQREIITGLPVEERGANIGVFASSWERQQLVDNPTLLEIKKQIFVEAGKAHTQSLEQKSKTTTSAVDVAKLFD